MGAFTPVENQDDPPSPVRTYVTGNGLTVQLFYEGASESVTNENLIDVTLYTVGDPVSVTPVQDYCDSYNWQYQSSVEAVSTKSARVNWTNYISSNNSGYSGNPLMAYRFQWCLNHIVFTHS